MTSKLIDRVVEKAADNLANRIVEQQEKHDLPSGFTLTNNFMHGPNGIFGTPGLDRDVFSTRVNARGLLEYLPAMPTNDLNPITAYLTGFTAGSGSEPSTVCAECVKAGQTKSCRQGTVFGLICRETDEIDLSATGERIHRGEFYDLRLVNDPLLNDAPLWVPGSVPKGAQQVLNREVLNRWLTLGVEFENTLSPLVFTGNPANNVGTGYAEYLGLESLVTTGHTDVLSSVSCPSLDSEIVDFNYLTVEANAATIFSWMTAVYRKVKHSATTMRMLPVTWTWVMKDSMFRKLADFWPCVYASFRCNATTNDLTNNTDAMAMRRMADDLYNGRYLLIDGERIPVILDDSIPYEYNGDGNDATHGLVSGQMASDIYLLPWTVKGGVRVLFMEYFDYSGPGAFIDSARDGRVSDAYWTDGGRFIWTHRQTDWCVSWKAKIRPRLRLLTPHLAARLQDVAFSPLISFREPLPSQQYFVDGGNTTLSNAPYDLTS